MTLTDFLNFISQTPNHFIGFLIVLVILSHLILKIIQLLFCSNKENKQLKNNDWEDFE